MRALGRRGDVSHHAYFVLFEIILVAMLAAALFSFVESIRKNTVFEKNYLSRDAALTVSALQFAPAPFYYDYFPSKVELDHFDFGFHDSRADVSENPKFFDKKPLVVYYPFASDLSRTAFSASVSGSQFIHFLGSPAFFAASSEKFDSKQRAAVHAQLSCSDIRTAARSYKIAVDAAHGLDFFDPANPRDSGFSSTAISESRLVLPIAQALSSYPDFVLTRDSESDLSVSERLSRAAGASVILSLHASDSKQGIRAIIPFGSQSAKAVKLACLIINSLLANPGFSGGSIVQLDSALLSKEDPLFLLSEGSAVIEPAGIFSDSGENFVVSGSLRRSLRALPKPEVDFLKSAELAYLGGNLFEAKKDAVIKRYLLASESVVYSYDGAAASLFALSAGGIVSGAVTRADLPEVFDALAAPRKDKVVVVLELGNVQISREMGSAISKSIYGSVRRFYSDE